MIRHTTRRTTLLHTLPRLALLGAVLALGACAARNQAAPQITDSTKPATEMRAMQTRIFDTPDRSRILRATASTLQDRGYTFERISAGTDSLTATKFAGRLTLTATASAHGARQTALRVNAAVIDGGRGQQVDTPAFYRDMVFSPLGQTLALTPLEASPEGAVTAGATQPR